jgi:hypothetical protein
MEHFDLGQLADHVCGREWVCGWLGFGGLSLMARKGMKIGMTPSHPGGFIKT